ncbi:MAG: sodium:solute symporter family protein, partial [Rickettsiales bacterium]|nr:sodium:solute symporter family protein [Rickettsiales bacterium]
MFFGINMIKIVSYIDIVIVVGYMFFCLVIGLLNYGKIKNIRDYALGVKPFSTVVLLATIFATRISASYIGHIGKVHNLGLVYIIPRFLMPLSLFILAKLLVNNLEIFRKNNFITLSDVMEHWYGKAGRWTTNAISILLSVGITAMSSIAIGYLLHYFLGISETIGIVMGLIIVTSYSVCGGIVSVAFTDLFQFLVFFIALPIACFIGYQKVGGLEKIWFSLPETHTQISKDKISLFASFIFYALIPYCTTPYIQRALIAKDKNQFLKSFIGATILLIPLLIVMCLIGLITYYNNSDIKSDTALYYFIDYYLPIGLKGLMISGVLAVVMSTQDSYLNSTSILISHDICKQIWSSLTDKQELLIARLSCIGVALVSVLIIFFGQGIMETIWIVYNFFSPLIAIPMIAGLIGIRISKKSFIFVVLASVTTVTITQFITGAFDTRSLAIGVITSTVVLYVLHKRYKRESIFSFPKINVGSLFDNLNNRVLNNSYSIGSLYTVGVVLCINFLVGVFCTNLDFFNPLNISLVVMAFLFLTMLLNELWSFQLKRYLIDIWRFCLIVGLLFIPSYIFFAHDFHILWLCNLILSAILYIVMSDIVIGIAFILIAGSLGYLLPQIFHTGVNIIETTFASISCSLMLVATAMQLYNRHTIAKASHREIMHELKTVMQEKIT